MFRQYINIALIVIVLYYFIAKLSNTVVELLLGKGTVDDIKSHVWSWRPWSRDPLVIKHPLVLKSIITCSLGVGFMILSNNFKNFVLKRSFLITGFLIFITYFTGVIYLLTYKHYNIFFSGIVFLFIIMNNL